MIVPLIFELFILPFHINCKCGIIVYEGNHEQPICLINISGYEFPVFLN